MSAVSERTTGDAVWLPCDVTNGMFPHEQHIRLRIPGLDVEIEGFVPRDDVREGHVRAVVTEVTESHAALLFRGEILSRTNPVLVPGSTEVEVANGERSR